MSRQLDAVLPPDATGKLRDHLDSCAECRRYHEDLRLGQRLLAATEPRLPENFDWKLQLKLNQTLQQSAGESRYRWHEEPVVDRWIWVRNFGAATAVGLAAVLALAMFFGPVDPGTDGTPYARRTVNSPMAANGADRRPLFQPGSGGLYSPGNQRQVSSVGRNTNRGSTGYLDRRWAGANTEAQRTIWRLRLENQHLNNMLLQYRQSGAMNRAQLDTNATDALDLQHER